MKTMSEIKKSLGDEVATKKSLTAARRDIKRVPMSERSPERHGEMLRLLGEAGACKERVRVLACFSLPTRSFAAVPTGRRSVIRFIP